MSNRRGGIGNSLAGEIVETGTFTPTLQDASFSDAEGQTYSVQDGRYTKIGNRVFFEFRMVITSLGTLLGTAVSNIAGFPFPIVGDISTAQLGQGVSLALPSVNTVTGRMDSATNTMRIMILNQAAGHGSVTVAQVSIGGDIKFSGHYRTN